MRLEAAKPVETGSCQTFSIRAPWDGLIHATVGNLGRTAAARRTWTDAAISGHEALRSFHGLDAGTVHAVLVWCLRWQLPRHGMGLGRCSVRVPRPHHRVQ